MVQEEVEEEVAGQDKERESKGEKDEEEEEAPGEDEPDPWRDEPITVTVLGGGWVDGEPVHSAGMRAVPQTLLCSTRTPACGVLIAKTCIIFVLIQVSNSRASAKKSGC
jgi:hypothetical protein